MMACMSSIALPIDQVTAGNRSDEARPRHSEEAWATFARVYREVYVAKLAEALDAQFSKAMARYVAEQHATRVAARRSGIRDPSATAREIH